MIHIDITTVLAALIGAGFTVLGVWSAAIADRIRGTRAARTARQSDAAAPAPRASEAPRARPARPRRASPPPIPRAARAPRPRKPVDEVRDWLRGMGYGDAAADVAARRAVMTAPPTASIEDLIHEAIRHTPEAN